ncbi:MAG: tRNA preQ1(34) S-adenosylmethionine ribosyltransferase-isomerase QueA [Candidatus Aminicenantales bacterium]
MDVSAFDYTLPKELIAQRPCQRRDQSRMMVVERTSGQIIHSRFAAIGDYFSQGDILVLNTSRVIPARIWGQTQDGREVEFLFLKEAEKGVWKVLCRPAKKIMPGAKIHFAEDFSGEVIAAGPEGTRTIRLSSSDVVGRLKAFGYAPLPPYIQRKKNDEQLRELDRERYQTVFARKDGSIAAPTAGLHFTREILAALEQRGVQVCPISLDVGWATFQPVRVARVEEHRMLEETYEIPVETARALTEGKREGRCVTAVGTTCVRALESAWESGRFRAGRSATDLFIFPGYRVQAVDRLLTNFHLPKSTLLMLVSAFAGIDLIKRAYREAVEHRYRFYSYGDCMLIL